MSELFYELWEDGIKLAPVWAVEFIGRAFAGDFDRTQRLWDEHIHGPDDVLVVVDVARVIMGVSREDLCEELERFLKARAN